MDTLVAHLSAEWDQTVVAHISQLKRSCLGGNPNALNSKEDGGGGGSPASASNNNTPTSPNSLITNGLPNVLSCEDLLRSMAVAARGYTHPSGASTAERRAAAAAPPFATSGLLGGLSAEEDEEERAPRQFIDTVDTFGAFSLFPPAVHAAWMAAASTSASPSTSSSSSSSLHCSDEALHDTIKIFMASPSVYNVSGLKGAAGSGGGSGGSAPFSSVVAQGSGVAAAGSLGGALATSVGSGSVTSSSQLASNLIQSSSNVNQTASSSSQQQAPFYTMPSATATERLLSFEAAITSVCSGASNNSSGTCALREARGGAILKNEERLLQYINTLVAMKEVGRHQRRQQQQEVGAPVEESDSENDDGYGDDTDVTPIPSGSGAMNGEDGTPQKFIATTAKERIQRHYSLKLPLPAHLSTLGLGPSHRQCFYAVLLRLGIYFNSDVVDDDNNNNNTLMGGVPLSERLSFVTQQLPAAGGGKDKNSASASPNTNKSSSANSPSSPSYPPHVGIKNKPLPQRVIDELVPSMDACDASGTPSSGARKMILHCATVTVGDSDKFFVFLDEAKITLCAMLEDVSLVAPSPASTGEDGIAANSIDYLINNSTNANSSARRLYGLPVSSSSKAQQQQQQQQQQKQSSPSATPPPEVFSSSLPFAIAPIFYITTDMPTAYHLARAMYQQLWCHMARPTVPLVHMCCLFEHVVAALTPLPALHVVSAPILCSPLAHAFNWMVSGFATVLPTAEVLAVWDRLVAYMSVAGAESRRIIKKKGQQQQQQQQTGKSSSSSARDHNVLTLLPFSWLAIVAASLFVLRAPLLLNCRTRAEASAVLSDYNNVKIIPLVAKTLRLYGEAVGCGAGSIAPPPTVGGSGNSVSNSPQRGVGGRRGGGGAAAGGSSMSGSSLRPSASQRAKESYAGEEDEE